MSTLDSRRYPAHGNMAGIVFLHAMKTRTPTSLRVAIVAAHQDDETIGIGGSSHLLTNPVYVYTTNGAPLNEFYAKRAGFETNEQYSSARFVELEHALTLCDNQPTVVLGAINDQEASLNLSKLTEHLVNVFTDNSIEVVVTQPYEGGHPDHDATSFAVYYACRMMCQRGLQAPQIVEMTCYHANEAGGFVTNQFLHNELDSITAQLSESDQQRKLAMFECFETQGGALKIFKSRLATESFRIAPAYDYQQRATSVLHYERRNWCMTGEKFCELATELLAQNEAVIA